MKKFFVSSIVAISLLSGLGVPSVAVAAGNDEISSIQQNKEKAEATNEFLAMQDQITSVLRIEDGHYVYNKEDVKNIVYSFDFDKLNQQLDLDYTKESFYSVAIESIDNTQFQTHSISKRNANPYNRNYFEEGWNYYRSWQDHNTAKGSIKNMRDAAFVLNGGGGIATVVGIFASGPLAPFAGVVAAVSGLTAMYFDNMATNTELKNNYSGIVLEANKFTFVYSVWSQNEYKGK
ncbi:hypothetical protein [Enterococcus faecalis]|uniref:hypothetical protein n=1 Tax=Enterococcus faecalis TaxID=1351 RepID=UPI000F64A99B|nr:hypothetical protein [Enterococcus faecalis]RRQ95480.1 hypothetical protein CUR52_08560 [Enterococcus faecalis]HCT4590642.1 hypothetical protein [Enterococcus faecalis]